MSGTDLSTQQYDAGCTKVQPDEINALVTWLKKDIKTTVRVTTTYVVLATDVIIFADPTAGSFAITLPAGVNGKSYKIINVATSGTNTVTVNANGSETIYGDSSFVMQPSEIININFETTSFWW